MPFPKLTAADYVEGNLDSYDFYNVHNGFTAVIEDGWVKDPNDKGGETLFGISRTAHPDWQVWDCVDNVAEKYGRGTTRFRREVEGDKLFFISAARIFYACYWLPIRADETQQEVATVMYDLAVHAGVKRSVKMAQLACNNVMGTKLMVDGKLGARTRNQLCMIWNDKAVEFAKEYLHLRLAWHIKANPEYTKGFTRRVHNLWRFMFEDEM